MPVSLAPADPPSEEQFTLSNIATEFELEPRRPNLFDAFNDANDFDGQDEPLDVPDDAAGGGYV